MSEFLSRVRDSKRLFSIIGVSTLLMTGCTVEPATLPNRPADVVEHVYDDFDLVTRWMGRTAGVIADPEHYYLILRQCQRFNANVARVYNIDKQGCIEAGVEVTKDIYDKYPDGSQIIIDDLQDKLLDSDIPPKRIHD